MRKVPVPASLLLPADRDPLKIPPGWGFRRPSLAELDDLPSLLHTFQVWEYPQWGHRYLLGIDPSEGLGQDRAVIDVLRLPTIDLPAEQVAQFISTRTSQRDIAFIADAIGRLYRDRVTGLEAMACVETNRGDAVQELLDLHLGYRHFYQREYTDAFDPSTRLQNKKGWYTDRKNRPAMLQFLLDAVTTYDPLTGAPDLKVNSPFTLKDMGDFNTSSGLIADAEAAPGQHDDCVIALAIANFVAYRLLGGEREPLAELRRRKRQEQSLIAKRGGERPDWRNLPYSEEEVAAQMGLLPADQSDLSDPMDDQTEGVWDERGRIWLEDFQP